MKFSIFSLKMYKLSLEIYVFRLKIYISRLDFTSYAVNFLLIYEFYFRSIARFGFRRFVRMTEGDAIEQVISFG